MTAEDERYWITFNGEIYNYLELRKELEDRGRRFATSSDTEVLLQCYAQYGPACLTRLRGMFAFAIWDSANRTLFLARDRVGKKPLFYRVDRDGLAFASEPKAFVADPGFEPRANPRALALYLAYGYVPDPLSAFDGVQKLAPGHCLTFSAGATTVERYWQLRYQDKQALTLPEASERLMSHLRDAVRLRLMSDVPLGAFLSGGIDSSIVVALMSEHTRARTFSIGFEESAFNELAYARLVAQRYGTAHEEFVVRPDAAAIVPKLAWQYGEPFADSSAIPMYYLSELTRRHVTVALSGDGGDESFAGYTRYLATRKKQQYNRLPQPVRNLLGHVARVVPGQPPPASYTSRAKRWAEVMGGDQQRQYAESVMSFDSVLHRRMCTKSFLEAVGPLQLAGPVLDAFASSDAAHPVDAMMHVDIQTYLPGDILAKVDIATMAHGLEARAPLLDQEVMEFAATLEPSLKLHGTEKKHLLKEAARQLLPDELLTRPKKGFSVPLAEWLRGDLQPMVRDVLLSRSTAERGIFSRRELELLLDEHGSGRYEWHTQIYTALMLELWFRTCVDRTVA